MNIEYLLCAIPIILFVILKLYQLFRKRKNVCIVVLGDLGRSPRMQYHAISFAKSGLTVDLVGYPGSSPLKEITENPRICVYYLRPLPEIENMITRSAYYVIKTLWQASNLLLVLFCKRPSNYILIQNPPAIPTIPICWFVSFIHGSQFIIDWHNYAHTLMALSLRDDHFLVKCTKAVETWFGCKAHRNFCVSQAMKEDLESWGIISKVLYDRPANEFHPISLTEKHAFLLKLSENYDALKGQGENSTVFTECINSEVQLLPKRPGLIVSSTSWTEDEDFSILLSALEEYENAFVQDTCNLPDLICIITGKGPLKKFYSEIIKLKSWKHITVITPWLENEDYPKILGSADLGICLHTSSSGLDLPMKVIDMFGCELPVCSHNYKCLSELVKHNENGMVFSSDKELAIQLKSWFENFPNNEIQHELDTKFRKELHKFQEKRWQGEPYIFLNDDALPNNRPIIGVLAQEISYHLNQTYADENYHSYIAASYVKYIEGAGARVVPIWIGKDDAYYEDILGKINGVLWPGGGTYFNQSNGYADAGYKIYNIAKRMNKDGDYFPIFGICLGFELLTFVAADRVEHRENCDSEKQPLPLVFTPNYRKSRMYNNIPSDIIEILKTENVTANYHHYCVTKNKLQEVGLIDKFRILSTNRDFDGFEFISSLEHVSLPFYGLQFHPEKNLYEWVLERRIPHGENAVKATQYFANFFVKEARKSTHKFPTKEEEAASLIYNYPVTYTGLKKSVFEQCYMFKESSRM